VIIYDEHGHIRWKPIELFQLAIDSPRPLINDFLTSGTPAAFATRDRYSGFLEAVAERTGVHPRNLFLRGSCQVGFSIAPRPKVWTSMHADSDLDLAIVDADYFQRINQEVQKWADDNRAESIREDVPSFDYVGWQRDRRLYNCCRAEDLPLSVCVHHQETMATIAGLQHCGSKREVNAFVFRDWWSVYRRYEWDLKELIGGVRGRRLTPPGDVPLPP